MGQELILKALYPERAAHKDCILSIIRKILPLFIFSAASLHLYR